MVRGAILGAIGNSTIETSRPQALAIALMGKGLGAIAGGRLELPTPAL
jgi:hypothetical protein